MANIFNSVKIKLQRKNKFNLSFASRLTTEFGRLTPILFEETLPNDTFKIRSILRCQFAPMKFPVMQKFTAYVHYFFVPRRLLMDDWQTFITGGDSGVDEVSYPTFALNANLVYAMDDTDEGVDKFLGASSLLDYLGFPTIQQGVSEIYYPTDDSDYAGAHNLDALPFKAYQLVYNEWYRDENLSEEIELFTDVSGFQNSILSDEQIIDLMRLRNRAWRKDYFTSALPDPQRGPDVTLPLFGELSISPADPDGHLDIALDKGRSGVTDRSLSWHRSGGDQVFLGVGEAENFANNAPAKVKGSVDDSDLAEHLDITDSNVRSATINEVRRAFAIQRWYELAARAGNRYIESILGHFGIRSSDARLQRPEYIGGSVVAVNVGDVLQTSESGETPLGTPAGIAQALGASKKVRYTCEEHGYILGILSIIPEASYPQGMPRKFMRRDKFDFAWPLLANIGEQEIKKGELFYDYTKIASYNDNGFGYAPRYAEYKFGLGQVHGDFRTSLRDFHDARFFTTRPALNQEFIEVSTANDGDDGLNRIFAVQSSDMADHLWVSMYNDIVVRRVLPKYGTPV